MRELTPDQGRRMTSWSEVTEKLESDFLPDQTLTDEDIIPCVALPDRVSFKEKSIGKNYGEIPEEQDDLSLHDWFKMHKNLYHLT